jgi:uncharacterized protein
LSLEPEDIRSYKDLNRCVIIRGRGKEVMEALKKILDEALYREVRRFLEDLHQVFAGRIAFLGLQGSYARGEATEHSDVDLVVILDVLRYEDLEDYDALLAKMMHQNKMCGFLSGKAELAGWSRADLFQFYHDTVPLFGSLDALLPAICPKDVQEAIRTGACNIYHMCVHNRLYEKDATVLQALYKAAVFVLQAVVYARTGIYRCGMAELQAEANEEEKKILCICQKLKNEAGPIEAEALKLYAETLFEWAGRLVREHPAAEK